MPIKRPELANDEIYHVIIRGVGDLSIFKTKKDYYRCISSLYEFNTSDAVVIRERHKKLQNRELFSVIENRQGKMLVEILAFCLMPNHIHLLLRQVADNGISQFMRKLGAGYAAYFNKVYKRKGHLFQGRFHAVHIKSEAQLQAVFVYIHTNPASLVDLKWKKGRSKKYKKIINFLNKYKWSSYLDYINKKNFPELTERNFILKVMGGKRGCQKFVEEWVKGKKELYFADTDLE